MDAVPVDVVTLAKKWFIDVRFEKLEPNVSGFLFVKSGKATVVINQEQPVVRQRFTVAHELGHYVLHADKEEDIFIDEKISIYHRANRNGSNAVIDAGREKEANRFAAELLMPKNMLFKTLIRLGEPDISDDLTIYRVANIFAVSEQALNIRMTDLGLFL